jgi:putative ABC transport system ATP-binding protein
MSFQVLEETASQSNMVDPPIKKKLGPAVVTLRNVKKYYQLDGGEDAVKALDGVTLAPESEYYPVRRGEFVMLRGPSGGGKTTTLNIIGTIDRATEGTVEILGTLVDKNCKDAFLSQTRLEKIGFVFQTFNLLATMSAFENVELPMTLHNKLSAKERKKKARELLRLVGLQDRENHLPSELSGGEQQRVTIARSLANDPVLLLLDEPTGDLDTKNTVLVMDLLLKINQELNITMIMVSHNPDLETYADRILYIRNGALESQALNEVQTALNYDRYIEYLNSLDNGK